MNFSETADGFDLQGPLASGSTSVSNLNEGRFQKEVLFNNCICQAIRICFE